MGDDELCKICMDNPVDCVMLECGHMCTCTGCGKLMNECPICRLVSFLISYTKQISICLIGTQKTTHTCHVMDVMIFFILSSRQYVVRVVKIFKA